MARPVRTLGFCLGLGLSADGPAFSICGGSPGSTRVWKSTSALGSRLWTFMLSLHAIEPTRPRGQRRVVAGIGAIAVFVEASEI